MSDAWVCPECALDYGTLHPPFAINTLKNFPRRYKEALEDVPGEDTDALLRTRPAEGVWSAMEYAAHVADSMGPFATVVHRMYTEDNPDLSAAFEDPDEQTVLDKTNEQDKDAILARLSAGVDELVNEAGKVDANGWSRMASFGWGDRDLLTMLQNSVHEGIHHLMDIESGMKKVRTA
jgi:hypothetical protein